VANLFLFNMPLVLLEIVVQVKQWTPFRYYACVAMVYPHSVEVATALIYLLAYQRVLNDVIMGFATDKQVGMEGGGGAIMDDCTSAIRKSVKAFRSGSVFLFRP
jgi:hypothetical protein